MRQLALAVALAWLAPDNAEAAMVDPSDMIFTSPAIRTGPARIQFVDLGEGLTSAFAVHGDLVGEGLVLGSRAGLFLEVEFNRTGSPRDVFGVLHVFDDDGMILSGEAGSVTIEGAMVRILLGELAGSAAPLFGAAALGTVRLLDLDPDVPLEPLLAGDVMVRAEMRITRAPGSGGPAPVPLPSPLAMLVAGIGVLLSGLGIRRLRQRAFAFVPPAS